jgi:hypothetical protein
MLIPVMMDTRTTNKTTQQYFRDAARLVWLWFHTVSENIEGDCGESLDIYLYLTQHYKRKPPVGPIDTIHANTALYENLYKKWYYTDIPRGRMVQGSHPRNFS